jgi:hypothetical protein
VVVAATGQVCPTASCTFKSVSEAVLSPYVADGDVLFVTSGSYAETIVYLNKTLSIM